MLISGKTNVEEVEFFKVSVATGNNHRTRLKREAMSFTSKRGRRPKLENIKEDNMLTASKNLSTKVKMENYDFIINGVVVTVSGKAKNVHIVQDSMEVNF